MPKKSRFFSRIVGERGSRVSVLERVTGGPLYLKWWDAERRSYRWLSLKHSDKTRAILEATEFSEAKAAGIDAAANDSVTLNDLFNLYFDKKSRHATESTRGDHLRRMDLWNAALGPHRDIRSLDLNDASAFVEARRRGTLKVKNRRISSVSETTIGHDLIWMKGVLSWATETKRGDSYLLDRNPFASVRRLRSPNQDQTFVASEERYRKVLDACDATGQPLLRPLLQLTASLGWRIDAVCRIQLEDLSLMPRKDAPHGRLLKRADSDKTGREMWVPLSAEAKQAIGLAIEAQEVRPLRGYLFPAPRKKGSHFLKEVAIKLLHEAERLADVEVVKGAAFHAYRRKWATDRKHLPLKDVAYAGGWKNEQTLLRHYQKVDDDTLLRVVENKNE